MTSLWMWLINLNKPGHYLDNFYPWRLNVCLWLNKYLIIIEQSFFLKIENLLDRIIVSLYESGCDERHKQY
jgi:hypothetical protein